jgi:hypothetical protein
MSFGGCGTTLILKTFEEKSQLMKLLRFIFLLALLPSSISSLANHVLGGNITWECAGAGQYEVTFTLYKDCYGTPGDPLSESILFYPSGCGGFEFSANLDFVSATEISDLCASELLNSSCAGGFQPGTSQVVYSGIVTLDPGCVWQAVWNSGDWNYFGNMDAIPQNAYIHSFINTAEPCDTSPVITSTVADPQVPYICLNDPFSMTLPVVNSSGYTLTYTLTSSQTTGATSDVSINAGGYSIPAGMTLVGNQLSWTPTNLGNYAVSFEIEIFDGANYIGTIYENMCFVVRNCVPTVTSFDIPQVTSVGPETTLTGNNNVQVCAGDSLIFTVEANNAVLSRGITLTYTPIGGLPLSFTQTGLNPAVGTFSLLATPAMVGGSPYVLNIHAEDDACPNPDIDDITVNITISPNVELITNDTTICNLQTVNLAAFGLPNNAYNWTVLPGGDNTPPITTANVASQNVAPNSTTTYQVSATGIPASCTSSDQVTVSVAMTDLTLSAMSETCSNDNGAIDLTVLGAGSGNYDFQWTGINTVDLQEDQFGLSGGVGQNYSVTVTDNVFGCSLTESTNVADVAQPSLTFHNDTTICAGGTANLYIDFTAGIAPFDVFFTADVLPSPADVINVPDGYSFNVSPTQTTIYTIDSITDNSGCSSIINASRTVTIRPTVTANFLPEADICVGDNLVLDIDHSQAGSYSVVYSIGGTNQTAITVADNGTVDVPDPATSGVFTYDIESVSYTTLPACPSSDVASPQIQVDVNALPTAVLSGDATICAGECHNFTITLTGTGPWIVDYTRGGIAQPALNISIASAPGNIYTWNVCPAGTSLYCITSVDDANCTGPVVGECATITIAPFPVVNYTLNDTQLCIGDCTPINVTVSPASPFTIEFSETPDDTGFNAVFTNQNSPFNASVCPLVDTDYCLDSVYFTGVPQCATVLNECILVEVHSEIAVVPTDTICSNTSQNYQIVYTVSGGELPYNEVATGMNGTFDVGGTVFTTNPVLSGIAGGPWVFSDDYACNTVSVTMGIYTCPVLSDAGTMVLAPQETCGNTPITAIWNNDGFLDANDQQMFILHTTADSTLGTIISTDCDDATFGDADSPLSFGVTGNGTIQSGVVYYISSVVGNDDLGGGGCVSTAAANVQISPGTPVTWYQLPQVVYSIDDTEICAGECATITATVTPNNSFTIQFTEDPDDLGLGMATGQFSPFDYIICPLENTEYCLDSVYYTGVPQCATVLNQCIDVNFNEEIDVAAIDTVCNNISTQYQVVYEISGGEAPYSEDPLGVNGTFDVGGTMFTTDWINSGSAGGPWDFTDVNECNIESVSMSAYSCPIITDPGDMAAQLLSVCGGSVVPNSAIGVFQNNAVLDGNDAQMFILHTNANATLGTVIAVDCDDATFGDVDSPLSFGSTGLGVVTSGTVYYISSVAGDATGLGVGGCVDLTAPNIQISIGEPVVWYQSSTATLSAVADTSACQGQSVALQVDLTGQGPWTLVYNVNGANPVSVTVPVGGSPHIINVVTAGTYCLQTVNNSPANCPGTVSGCVDVVMHPLPTATLSSSSSTCSGIDHCFEITLTGEAPWDLVVNNPGAENDTIVGTTDNPYSYCASVAGPYQILNVVDDFGCVNATDGQNVVLTVYPSPTIAWTIDTDTSFCAGSCIDLSMAATGTATFDVTITSPDPAVTSASLQNIGQVHTVTICEPGDYILVDVTDSNGCLAEVNDTIHVDEIALPIADAGPDLDQCIGLPILIGTPEIPGQSYTWTPATGMAAGQSTLAQPTVALNVANVYDYTVTAQVGQCSSSDVMLLTIHVLPDVSITADDDSICFNTCADLTATSVSGTAAYLWDASPTITTPLDAAGITVCPNISETYLLTATETHNLIECVSSESIFIVIGEPLAATADFSEEVCFGTCDGFATFDVTGGFAPYLINNDPSDTWEDLCPGTYDYTVLDSQGCTFDDTFDILERPEEVIDVLLATDPVCFGDATGSILLTDATATNFSMTAPIGPVVTDNLAPFAFEDLPAGDYIITMFVEVEPGITCETSENVSLVSLSPEFTIELPWTEEQYCLGAEVCFEADLIGGLGTTTAHWNTCPDAVGCEISTINPFCLNLLQDSTLYVYGTDENMCPTDTVWMTAALYPDISLILQNNLDSVEICQFECIDLSALVSGGNGNIFVDWYEIPVDNAPFETADTVEVCPFSSSYYWVTANDGCSTPVLDTILVVVHETPIVDFETDTLEGCFPATIEFFDLSVPVADAHTCRWSFGDGASLIYCGDTLYAYPGFGDFYPSLTITTEYGCVGTDTLDVPVVIHGYPEIDFTWEPQPVSVLEREVQFVNLTEGATSFNWNFYLTGSSALANPSWTFPDIEQADFNICLEATNQYGCKDTLCQSVYIESILLVYVPNSFTPDADGINDVFIPIVGGIKPESYKFWIFNRWGDPLFYSEEIGEAWTGGSDSGDYFVEDGTYVWRLECEALEDGELKVLEGHVNILR